MDKIFQGWQPPQENWSKLPHEFFDILPEIKTAGELKVILYILRHTWGYGDSEKRITLDEFENGRKRKDGTRIDGGTGMSRNTVLSGLELAVEHGFICVNVDSSDKARIKKTFAIHSLDVQKLNIRGSEIEHLGIETEHRTEKETYLKNTLDNITIASFDNFISAWATAFPSKAKPRANTKSVKDKWAARLKDVDFQANWQAALTRGSGSIFLNKSGWFDYNWFLKNEENWMKVFNGNYDNPAAPKRLVVGEGERIGGAL